MFEERQRRAPPAELIRGLAVLAEPPTEEHAGLAKALGLSRTPGPADYSELFLFQLYPYASVHLGPEGMLGGEARARVAGFWRALGYEPPGEPDHLAALLGLYATLAEAEVDDEAERRLLDEGRRALLREHLSPWVFAFLTRVRELADPPYDAWAELLTRVLRAEVEGDVPTGRREALDALPEAHAPDGRSVADAPDDGAEEPLPLHLREAPGLPDPRESGAGDFVAGLLAPVRSGIVLTRADLAGVAAACDVGLRAGERRYALEHLLAQDGGSVLTALAREAGRQAELHRARSAWLGATADFLARRARSTAELLEVLAEDETARQPVRP